MRSIDYQVLARELLGEARELVTDVGSEATYLTAQLLDLQNDVEATLSALEVESNHRRALALRADLETFLPARKAAILSAAESVASATVQAKLKTALEVAAKGAVIVAKALMASAL